MVSQAAEIITFLHADLAPPGRRANAGERARPAGPERLLTILTPLVAARGGQILADAAPGEVVAAFPLASTAVAAACAAGAAFAGGGPGLPGTVRMALHTGAAAAAAHGYVGVARQRCHYLLRAAPCLLTLTSD